MRYLILSVLLVGMLAGSASAAEGFNAVLHAQKDIIFPDEVAYFTLSVTNLQDTPDLFSVFTPEYDWILDTNEGIGQVEPGETNTVIVHLIPKDTVPTGPRSVRIRVRSTNTGDVNTITKIVTVRSLNSTNRTYAPSIHLSARVDDQVDPREDLDISVFLRNRNARDYDRLQITIESDLFKKDYTTSLGPVGQEGEKTNQISVLLDPHTPPGSHPLTITLRVDDLIVNEYETAFSVIPFTAVTPEHDTRTVFFKEQTNYTVVNNGNTPQEAVITHTTNFFKRLFTTASADYDVEKSAGERMLVFTVPLEPNERAEITVTENYRLLFMLALLVVLSVISYYLFRSPVVLRKEALIYGSSTDGVSHIKIRLFVKNRSAKAIHNIHVIDKVTSMADVVKETSLGTLHPTKIIRKKGHGTLVRWDIDTLDAFEERIITYQVRTELKLIGDVYLPAMKVKFDQAGRERTSYSNEVNIPREG